MAVCGRSGCGKLSFGAVGQVRCVTVLFVSVWQVVAGSVWSLWFVVVW